MLLALVVILILFWAFGGLAFHVGGDLIHILLIIALICLILNFWPRLRSGGD
jgi:hypothetical protein